MSKFLSSLGNFIASRIGFIPSGNLTSNNVQDAIEEVSNNATIETWTDGTSWYRKYPDGWLEQGGLITGTSGAWKTGTFILPFISPPPAFLATATAFGVFTSGGVATNTTFSVYVNAASTVLWEAKGRWK